MDSAPTSNPPTTSASLLAVSERAAQEIKNALGQQEDAYAGIRVGVQGGGCCGGPQYALGFEKETRDGDVVAEAQGIKFFVSPSSAELVKGSTIDFVETPMGSGFKIENPNEDVLKAAGSEHGHGHGHGGGGGGCGCGGGGGGCGGGGHGGGGCGC